MRRRSGDAGTASRRRSEDRAVSDVVGYVLVFALVTATVATVFGVGIVGLEDRQNAERVENVERAFDVLDDNLRDIQRYEDPSRATEIRLSDGTLRLSQTANVTLETRNASGGYNNRSLAVYSLAYTNDDDAIVYEAGAWFRDGSDGSVMRSPPRFVGADNRTVLPVVRLLPGDGPTAVSGEGTVQVSATAGGSRTLEYPQPNSDAIDAAWVRVESPRAEAWKRYFSESDAFTVDDARSSEGEVVAEVDHHDRVYLRAIGVDVTLRR